MDSICGVLRSGLWFCFLLCVLPVAQAATTVPVPVPSAHATIKNSAGVTVSGNSLKVRGPLQGQYIPNPGTGTRVSLKVQPGVSYSIGRIINGFKPYVRSGFGWALGAAAVTWAINQLPGASFDPQTGLPVIASGPSTPALYECTSGRPWWTSSYHSDGGNVCTRPNAKAAFECSATLRSFSTTVQKTGALNGDSSTLYYYSTSCVDTKPGCSHFNVVSVNSYNSHLCPSGTTFDSSLKTCVTPPVPGPFSDADYQALDSKLNTVVNPDWLRDMLLQSCARAPNPETCADGLKDYQDQLLGPSTVPGGSTTTTSTYIKPDGTVGTKSSTTNIDYKVTYGPTSFTYNQVQTTTHTQDGVQTGQDVTQDTSDPVSEPIPPEESEQQEEPSPCTSNCDGPAYQDLYEPTDDTKEDHLESYSDRLSSVPIIAAAGSLFDVSVSAGSCPSWSYNSTLDIGVASMPIDLNFDYHCLPWFVSLGPWIQTIFLLGCTLAAIRIGIL